MVGSTYVTFLTDFHAFIASLGERRPTFQETSVALVVVNVASAMSIVGDAHHYCQILKYNLGLLMGLIITWIILAFLL
jgi:hypothetical protein